MAFDSIAALNNRQAGAGFAAARICAEVADRFAALQTDAAVRWVQAVSRQWRHPVPPNAAEVGVWQLPDSVSNMVREASGIALKAQSQFARVAGAETLEYQRAVLNLLEQSVGKWPGAELAVTAAKATLRSTTAAMETVQLTVQHTTELMGSGLAKTLAPKPGTAR